MATFQQNSTSALLSTLGTGTSTLSTSTMSVNLTTTITGPAATTEAAGMDNIFIVAMACFAAGAVLVVIAIIFIIMWFKRTSDSRAIRVKRKRSLDHLKYLEAYSIKTGGRPDEFTPKTTPKTLPRHNKEDKSNRRGSKISRNGSAHSGNGHARTGNGTVTRNGTATNGSAKHIYTINNNNVYETDSVISGKSSVVSNGSTSQSNRDPTDNIQSHADVAVSVTDDKEVADMMF